MNDYFSTKIATNRFPFPSAISILRRPAPIPVSFQKRFKERNNKLASGVFNTTTKSTRNESEKARENEEKKQKTLETDKKFNKGREEAFPAAKFKQIGPWRDRRGSCEYLTPSRYARRFGLCVRTRPLLRPLGREISIGKTC